MAVYQSSTGINTIKDREVRNYLAELDENLTYMFANLTPDDNNATSVPKLTLVQDGEKGAHFEISANGISAQLTDSDNIVATINMSSEGITISADKIALEGYITANSNFWIDEEGNMGAKNGSFQGNISASDIVIGGSGNRGSLKIKNASDTVFADFEYNRIDIGSFWTNGDTTRLGDFDVVTNSSGWFLQYYDGSVGMCYDGTKKLFVKSSGVTTFRVTSAGNVYFEEAYPQDSWWDGWSLTEVLQDLWDEVFPS